MRTGVCPLCRFFCAILEDGTLVQHGTLVRHSGAELPFLLCPGSRSPASGESRDPPPKVAGSAQARAAADAPA
jgi:hypothetical protein